MIDFGCALEQYQPPRICANMSATIGFQVFRNVSCVREAVPITTVQHTKSYNASKYQPPRDSTHIPQRTGQRTISPDIIQCKISGDIALE
jgi:hypothetical protein